jgi:hypothetical protein
VHSEDKLRGAIDQWVARCLTSEGEMIPADKVDAFIRKWEVEFFWFVDSELTEKGLLAPNVVFPNIAIVIPLCLAALCSIVFRGGLCGCASSVIVSLLQTIWFITPRRAVFHSPRVVFLCAVMLFGLIPWHVVISGTFWDSVVWCMIAVGGGSLFVALRYSMRWTVKGARLARSVLAAELENPGALIQQRTTPEMHAWWLRFFHRHNRNRHPFESKHVRDDDYDSSSGASAV